MFRFARNSDKAIVDRVLRGRRDDFAILVDRYLPMVHALAYAQLGNPEDADDISQEAFLKAYAMLNTLQNRAGFRPWLAAIARNAAISVLRARKPTAPLDEQTPSPTDPKRDAERKELHDVLRREILRLEPEYREVLLLHYFSGLKIREVAEAIGASPDAAAKRIQRARDALGASLVRELGLMAGEEQRDWRKARSRIMAALAGVPVAWEASAMAGMGGVGFATKLAAGGIVALLIAAAALLLPNPPPSNKSITTPEPAVAAEVTAPLPTRDMATADEPVTSTPDAAVPGYPEIPSDGIGQIRGRVIFPDGTPAPGAEVVLAQNESMHAPTGRLMPRRRTYADDSGSFTFDGVPIGTKFNEPEHYNVFTEMGNLIGVAPVFLPESGPCAFAWLELVPVSKKAGRVVNEAGQGIAGAIVYVPFGYGIDTTTDSAGAFSVPFVPEGELWVLAAASGYMWTRTDPIAAGTEKAVIEMRRGCTIVGTAVDTKSLEPVGGIEVKLTSLEPYVRYTSKTNADGAFEFSDLSTGEFTVSVSGTHYFDGDAPKILLGEPGESKHFDLRLRRGASIIGRIYRQSGQPVGDHSISCAPLSRESLVRSAADGTFRFDGLPAGNYTVRNVEGTGNEQKLTVDGIQEYEVNLEVEEGDQSVDGIVVDPDGEPVAGAVVQMARYGASTVTGVDGRFTLARLPDVSVAVGFPLALASIRVIKEGTTGAYKEKLGPQPAGLLRLTVSPPAWMTGRLVDERGQPVAGAGLEWDLTSDHVASLGVSLTTPGGRFAAANLPPGEYRLLLKQQGLAEVYVQTVHVQPGEFVEDVLLTLAPPLAGEIAGRVVDTTGMAVPKVSVSVEGPHRVMASSHTDDNGSFTLRGLPDGIYQVSVSATDYATVSRQAVVPAADPVDFILPKKGAISGHVYDAAAGMPLHEFEIHYEPGEYSETNLPSHYATNYVANEEGSFTISNLRDGPYTLGASADGYRLAFTIVDVPEGAHVEGLELYLVAKEPRASSNPAPPRTSLEGVVVDTAGRPLAGAGVFVQGFSYSPPNYEPHYSARCDDEGRFRVDSVSVNTTHVLATLAGYAPGAASVSLSPGVPGRAKIVLSAGGTVTGAAHFDGAPIADSIVVAESSVMGKRVYVTATTALDGSFTIADVPPGDAIIRLEMPVAAFRTRNYEHVVRVNAGRASDVSFALVGGAAVVEGKVGPNDDFMIRHVTVAIPLADGTEEVSTIETEGNGSFTIPMLPEAPIILRVRTDDEGEKEVQVTPAAGQPAYVEIDLAE